MKYLKKYENYLNDNDFFDSISDEMKKRKLADDKVDQERVDELNKNIDDAFHFITDYGFTLEKGHESKLFKSEIKKVYIRNTSETIGLEIVGSIENGKIKIDKEFYKLFGKDISEIYDELLNSLQLISGLSNVNFGFSFTNFYGQEKIIIASFQYLNENLDHLSLRGVNQDVTYFVHDEESNNTYFFLYNLSGDLIGYQKYNPDNSKEGGLGWMGRYFTKVHKEASGHSKIAVYGLETYDIKKDYFFIAEGIFDIIKVHNMGEPGIANLGCSLSKQANNWYDSLPQIKIVIQDRDDAGTELGMIGDYVYTVPEPYKDLGDMPQEEVNEFIKNIKKEIGI